MSAEPIRSPSSQRNHLYDCNYCKAAYPPDEEYRPGFCSVICEASDRAETVMNIIVHDHRYCTNCFQKIRDVYPPGRSLHSSDVVAHEEWGAEDDPYAFFRNGVPECAIGRAYPLPHCRRSSNAEVLRRVDGVSAGYEPHPDLWKERAVCSCGAMHHQTITPQLRARRLRGEYGRNLSDTIRQLLYEDEHEQRHDPDVLLSALQDAYLNLDAEFQQKQVIRCIGESLFPA